MSAVDDRRARQRAIGSLRQYRREGSTRVNVERARRARREWNARNLHAFRAYKAVARALAAGALVRPDACERCSKACKPYASQKGNYSRPLDIEWLCRRCDRFEKSKHHLTDADLGLVTP